MAATTSIKFTNFFEDGTTSDLVIGDFDSKDFNTTKYATMKAAVKEFNANFAESGYATKLQSKTGANWQRIDAVQVITTERIYYF